MYILNLLFGLSSILGFKPNIYLNTWNFILTDQEAVFRRYTAEILLLSVISPDDRSEGFPASQL